MLSHVLDERRCLRLLEESDAAELYSVIEANRAYLARWMPWAPGQTLDGTREFIRTSRVEIRAGLQTARSRAIPERLEFTEEGVRRQAERVGDRYVDHVVYSMLAAEWEQRSDRPSAV